MAYGYLPTNYYGGYYQQPQMVAQQTTPNNNGVIWVQGENGAKAYLVAPNTTVMLMDSETNKFYLKSSDSSGIPLPLRKFSYSEDAPEVQSNTQVYDAKSEIEAIRGELEVLKSRLAEDRRDK